MEDNQPEIQSSEPTIPARPVEPDHHKHAKLVLGVVFVILLGVITVLSLALIAEQDTDDQTSDMSQSEQNEAQETTDTNMSDSMNDEQNDVVATSEPLSAEWLLIETDDYSIKAPDGWELLLQDNGVLLMDCSEDTDCYEVTPGTRAQVTDILGGRDGLTGLLVTVQPAGYSENDLSAGYDFVGLVGANNRFSHYQKTYTDEPSDQQIGGQAPGTVSNIIVDTLFDERVAYVSYTVTQGQTDPYDTIIEMINTFTPSEGTSSL